jgi:hypothetical protein
MANLETVSDRPSGSQIHYAGLQGGNLKEEQASLTLPIEQSERPVERLRAAPPSDSPSTVLALIERLALDPRADVEKLERMMAMYERLKAKRPSSHTTRRKAGS